MQVDADFRTIDGDQVKGRYDAEWDTPAGHAGALILTKPGECWRIERGDVVAAGLVVRASTNIDLEMAEFNGLSIVEGILAKFPGEYVTYGKKRGRCVHRLNRENEDFNDYVYSRWSAPEPVTIRPAGSPQREPAPVEPE